MANDRIERISRLRAALPSMLADNTPFRIKAFMVATVCLRAGFSSLSMPILGMVLNQRFSATQNLSIQQKALVPAILFLICAPARVWLLWNTSKPRVSGSVNAEMNNTLRGFFRPDIHRSLLAIAGNQASLANSILVSTAILDQSPLIAQWIGITIFVKLCYIVDILNEVVDGFENHVATRRRSHDYIAAFSKQPYVGTLFRTTYYRRPVRELYPALHGMIGAFAVAQTSKSLLSNQLIAIRVILAAVTYLGCAHFTRSKLARYRDNLQAAGEQVAIDNSLIQSSVAPIHYLGKVISGEILVDILTQLKLSPRASIVITLAFAALGITAVYIKVFHTYISSTHLQALASGQEGIAMNYLLGHQHAAQIAPKLEIAMACVAIIIGIKEAFSNISVLQQEYEQGAQHITPYEIEQLDDEVNDDVVAFSPQPQSALC